jgi:hypothetical protein
MGIIDRLFRRKPKEKKYSRFDDLNSQINIDLEDILSKLNDAEIKSCRHSLSKQLIEITADSDTGTKYSVKLTIQGGDLKISQIFSTKQECLNFLKACIKFIDR